MEIRRQPQNIYTSWLFKGLLFTLNEITVHHCPHSQLFQLHQLYVALISSAWQPATRLHQCFFFFCSFGHFFSFRYKQLSLKWFESRR